MDIKVLSVGLENKDTITTLHGHGHVKFVARIADTGFSKINGSVSIDGDLTKLVFDKVEREIKKKMK